MSIALMTLAWKSSLPAGRKMVLLALCDNANDQGECFPSVPMLATKCSMGERTVQQHITDMEALGIVTREMRNGRSTIYHIDPRKFCTPAETAPPQISHPTPAESAPPPPQNLHHTPADFAPITINEPSIEPPKKRQGRVSPDKSDFDALGFLLAAGVDDQAAKDWLALRKAKQKPPSKTAIDGLMREAGKAGLSLDAAVRLCAERGWLSMQAEWLTQKQHASPQSANRNDRRGAAAAIFDDDELEIIDVN